MTIDSPDRVVIARAGNPYLDLLPHQPQAVVRKPGSLKGPIRISPGFDAADADIADSFDMRCLLLDTPVLLWWLGMRTRALIANTRNEVLISAATVWEMSIKRAKGLLETPDDMDVVVAGEGFSALPISLRHAQQAGVLPDLYRDPFDRMLIAQAQSEGLELLTADAVIPQYGIRCHSARL